jgi:hypothetical protein
MTENKNKVIGQVVATKDITYQDVEDLIDSAFAGGIAYWATLMNDTKEWEGKPDGIVLSEWAAHLLTEGKSVMFCDREDESEKWELTIGKMIAGINMNAKKRPHDADLDNFDADTADAIIQYALFNELVYG